VTWCSFDDAFYDDERFFTAGLAATGLYCLATGYACRHLTDGVVSRERLMILAHGEVGLIDALMRIGLIVEQDDGYFLADFFSGNETRETVEDRKRQKKLRAESAARSRWGKSKAKRKPADDA
jgi:hypothetical protein